VLPPLTFVELGGRRSSIELFAVTAILHCHPPPIKGGGSGGSSSQVTAVPFSWQFGGSGSSCPVNFVAAFVPSARASHSGLV
jgi:hypothetical protein